MLVGKPIDGPFHPVLKRDLRSESCSGEQLGIVTPESKYFAFFGAKPVLGLTICALPPIIPLIKLKSSPMEISELETDLKHLPIIFEPGNGGKAAARVLYIGKIAGCRKITEMHLAVASGDLRKDRWNNRPCGLPRAVGIERSRNDDRKLKRMIKTESYRISADLGGAIRRLRLRGCFSSMGTYSAVPYTSLVEV